jgi:hypothetical protein
VPSIGRWKAIDHGVPVPMPRATVPDVMASVLSLSEALATFGHV